MTDCLLDVLLADQAAEAALREELDEKDANEAAREEEEAAAAEESLVVVVGAGVELAVAEGEEVVTEAAAEAAALDELE